MASSAEVRHFRYDDLAAATGGFAPQNQIGSGAFGHVFRGTLLDGKTVAVKRIKESIVQRGHELDAVGALVSEAKLMDTAAKEATAAGCPHLVPLLGVCLDGATQLCLVTPFMSEGSLADHIGRPEGRREGKLSTGRRRVAAALDAARGVAALHSLRDRLLHRDIKPENVLLDGELRAYVADYGLSRLLPGDDTSMVSVFRGTHGYVAPEVVVSGRYSAKVRGG